MKYLAIQHGTRESSKKIKVFHWHGETFNMPAYAVRLAGSGLYPNQAFKYKDNAYAFQFHIEVTKEMIYDWFRSKPEVLHQLKTDTEKFYNVYHERAVMFYKAFFGKNL
jgi:GMP synthase-like glutamine amidotransferase